MKAIIIFAVLAVASALPPPNLQIFHAVDLRPLYVPPELVELIKERVNVAGAPADLPAEAVRIVDAPLEVEAVEKELVHFVDEAVESPALDASVDTVKFVDSPQEIEGLGQESVLIDEVAKSQAVDAASADAVKFVESPQEVALNLEQEPVRVVNEVAESQAVDAASADTVKFVESPQEVALNLEEEPVPVVNEVAESQAVDAVKFVNSPLEVQALEKESVRVAELPADTAAVDSPVDVVKVVDSPLEAAEEAVKDFDVIADLQKLAPSELESIRLVNIPIYNEEPQEIVQVVDDVPEIQYQLDSFKRYPDPTWR